MLQTLAIILFSIIPLSTCFEVAQGPPLLNGPVFSLATLTNDGTTNMNIVTYASPVSIRPERLWVIGLYKETYSYKIFKQTRKGILQLLTDDHIPIVRLLGGTTGNEVDKQAECRKLGVEWKSFADGHPQLLPGCPSYVCLELQGDLIEGGSHDIAVCRVTDILTDANDVAHLETQKLRDLGIITEQGRVADP